MAAIRKINTVLNSKKLEEFKKLKTKQAKSVYLKAAGLTVQEIAANIKTSVASIHSMLSKSKPKVTAVSEKPAKNKKLKLDINLDAHVTKQGKAVYLKSIGWTTDSIATLLKTSIASVHSMISKSKTKTKVDIKIKANERKLADECKARAAKPKKEKAVKISKAQAKEDAKRLEKHEALKAKDKIFNNSYFKGDKLKGDDYTFDKSIKLDPACRESSSMANLPPEKAIVYEKMRKTMIATLEEHPEMKEMFADEKKLNKSMLNIAFNILYNGLIKNNDDNIFMNVIYLFDFLSNISGVKYPNLFDMLEYKYQELLIQELDEEFNILGDYSNLRKMY